MTNKIPGPICGSKTSNASRTSSVLGTNNLTQSTRGGVDLIPSSADLSAFDCSKYGSIENLKSALNKAIGTANFYKILSDVTPGDRENGYHWNYGYKYFTRFRSSPLMKDPTAGRWIECVGERLQRAYMKDCFKHGANIEQAKSCAYETHAMVYVKCGICYLDRTFIKQLKVMMVPDSGDIWSNLGLKQMATALMYCVFRSYYADMHISRFETFLLGLDEEGLGKNLAEIALKNSYEAFPHILALLDLLGDTFNDDDVAYYFVKSLSDSDIDTLAQTADGRRILYHMKLALLSGSVFANEKAQADRIGDKDKR